jgi:hypothetical protein
LILLPLGRSRRRRRRTGERADNVAVFRPEWPNQSFSRENPRRCPHRALPGTRTSILNSVKVCRAIPLSVREPAGTRESYNDVILRLAAVGQKSLSGNRDAQASARCLFLP